MAILYEHNNTGDTTHFGVTTTPKLYAQVFTPTISHIVKIAIVKIIKFDAGSSGTVTVSIRATSANAPTGDDLASGTLDIATDITSSTVPGDWYLFDLGDGVTLTAGISYAIVVGISLDSSDTLSWRAGGSLYGGGATRI